MVQLLPLQRTAPAQALPPRQLMVLVPAEVVTVEEQLLGPVHSMSQLLPPQVIGALHEPIPEQVMVLIAPPPATPPAQDPMPLQVTVQVEPPH